MLSACGKRGRIRRILEVRNLPRDQRTLDEMLERRERGEIDDQGIPVTSIHSRRRAPIVLNHSTGAEGSGHSGVADAAPSETGYEKANRPKNPQPSKAEAKDLFKNTLYFHEIDPKRTANSYKFERFKSKFYFSKELDEEINAAASTTEPHPVTCKRFFCHTSTWGDHDEYTIIRDIFYGIHFETIYLLKLSTINLQYQFVQKQ